MERTTRRMVRVYFYKVPAANKGEMQKTDVNTEHLGFGKSKGNIKRSTWENMEETL